MSDNQPHRPRALAEKLNFLFATVRPPGQDREYSNAEVAQSTGVSGSYIGYLRKGVRDNPTVEAIQALARHFGVRPSYLVDDESDEEQIASIEAQVRLSQALANPAIEALAMRAAESGLSAEGLDAVAAMLEQVQRLERGAAKDRAPRDLRRARGHPTKRPRTRP